MERSPATICWFSCGVTSAVAAKWVLEHQSDDEETIVAYCDTSVNEHPDNGRFLLDCEEWFGVPIRRLRSTRYPSMRVEDVWRGEGAIVFPSGAPCTKILKKHVRQAFQIPGDVHVFGLAADEHARAKRLVSNNSDLNIRLPLIEEAIDKPAARRMLDIAGIREPAMYALGFNNNNCMTVVCPKGGKGYANHMRRTFPESFDRTAAIQRNLGVAFWLAADSHPNQGQLEGFEQVDRRIYLDTLDPHAGAHDPPEDIDCGVGCDLWGRIKSVEHPQLPLLP